MLGPSLRWSGLTPAMGLRVFAPPSRRPRFPGGTSHRTGLVGHTSGSSETSCRVTYNGEPGVTFEPERFEAQKATLCEERIV